MSTFNQRLARVSDQVRALNGGEDAARALIDLAADMDAYLATERNKRYEQSVGMLRTWNDFLNTSMEEAYKSGQQLLVIQRRQLAQIVAADPRWQGGYADALALLEEKRDE